MACVAKSLRENAGPHFALSPSGGRSHHRIISGGTTVRHSLALLLGTCLISVSTVAWVVAQQQPAKPPAEPSIDQVLQAVRGDLQGQRSDIVAKNISLTAAQAAKFWPMFETYQKEQNVIMDDQMKGIQQYVNNYVKLDDAGALGLITAHFDRDTRMTALRKKWLAEFQATLGAKLAVRVMQIDRRLSLAHQIAFAASIPLAR
jgi:Spy/CpxP family protein refolding chaperone